MWVKVDRDGLKMLKGLFQKTVEGKPRWCYVGINDDIPVVVIAGTPGLSVGQIWNAWSQASTGLSGHCRESHVGKSIGLLKMLTLIESKSASNSLSPQPLSLVIKNLINQYTDSQVN